jgi:hypothetical protein
VLVLFLKRESAEIFRVKEGTQERLAAGRLSEISLPGGFDRKVLVLSRGLVNHTRKRFPPTTRENIGRVIEMELEDIFPVKPSAFYFRIAEETKNYTLVDVWGWDASVYKPIEDGFSFGYVIPEDVLHKAEKPEVRVVEEDGFFHLIACDAGGFREGTTIKSLTPESLELFIKSLGEFGYELETIRLFVKERSIPEAFFGEFNHSYEEASPSTALVPALAQLPLKEFRVSRKVALAAKAPILMRAAIYCVIVYSCALLVSGIRFDRAINEASGSLTTMRAEFGRVSTQGKEDGGDAYRDMEERRKAFPKALPIIDSLARSLPADAHVTRIAFGEGTADVIVTARDPLRVLEILSKADCVKTANVKGTLASSKAGVTTFPVILELTTCE